MNSESTGSVVSSGSINLGEEILGSVATRFRKIVAEKGDSVAVVFKNSSISYRELDEYSDRFAQYIRKEKSIPAGEFVGLLIDRSIEMVSFIMGLFKAGVVYVPIVSSIPKTRLEIMMRDSKCKHVITNNKHKGMFEGNFDGNLMILEEVKEKLASVKKSTPFVDNSIDGESPAACFFTSGSTTGKPTGVVACHRNILHLSIGSYYDFELSHQDIYASYASINFTVSISDIFTSLMNGLCLVIIPEEARRDAIALMKYVNEKRISCLHLPPAMLRLLPREKGFDHPMTFLRVGGETCDFETMKFWSAKCKSLYNSFGMTETCATCIVKKWSVEDESSNIGRPICLYKVHIYGDDMKPVAKDTLGEMYIEGPGITLGYLNKPDAEKLKFLRTEKGTKLLRTGDLCKFNDRGDVVYVGRVDHQVKIRGNRVNLVEIENVIRKSELVKNIAVGVRKDDNLNKRLVAYFIPFGESKEQEKQEGEEDKNEDEEKMGDKIKKYLQERLNDYMVPNNYIEMKEFPSLVSGKIDRVSLDRLPVSFTSNDYIAPRNETEKKLEEIWKKVLGVQSVGIYDDFFELGGNSLSITIISQRVNEAFGKDYRTPTFLQQSSVDIDTMAKIIDGKVDLEKKSEKNLHLAELIREFRRNKRVVDWKCDPPMLYEVLDVNDSDSTDKATRLIADVLVGANGQMGEPLCSCLFFTSDEMYKFVYPFMIVGAKRELTVVAKNRNTGEVLGCYLGYDHEEEPELPPEVVKRFEVIFDILEIADHNAEEEFPSGKIPGPIFHAFISCGKLGAPPSMGLMQGFLCHEQGRINGYKTLICEPTAPTTQRMLQDLGTYKTHKEVILEEYEFKGTFPFKGIKDKFLERMKQVGYLKVDEIEKLDYKSIAAMTRPLDKPVEELYNLV